MGFLKLPDQEDEYYRIDYTNFIALNTNEIQKLKKRVAELETQLAELLNQRN